MSETVVKKKKHFLDNQTEEEVITKIVESIREKACSAYIFGSFGTDKFTADSDLDLIIIADLDIPFVERALEFPKLGELDISMDVLVYTSDEFNKIKAEEHVGFWKSAFATMRKIL